MVAFIPAEHLYAENTFIIKGSTSSAKQQQRRVGGWNGVGASVTILPELLEFYLLLYAAYAPQCFHFQISGFSRRWFIYCHCLDLECHHAHRWLQVTIWVPLWDAIGGSYLSKFDLLMQTLLVCFYNWVFQGVVCIVSGNKMSWNCTELDYNGLWHICITTGVCGLWPVEVALC